ncbi:MAG: tRNA (N6-threonylcarbamoyladenosine(37)-N6)-methyltransferase TrmO [Melioribacteraceae bacterium]
MMTEEIVITPIGILHSDLRYRYETPRQGILAGRNISTIELFPNNNFEQAVKDLEGFDRIWVLYQFHLNENWKPLVNPPRHRREKVGVFASRAPYRPNRIGMSCVKLEKVDGLLISVSESDILDGSPVIDIKPYLPYSDSFPDAATGWVKSGLENIFEVLFEQAAVEQCEWLKETAGINLSDFARLQLEFNPTDSSRKRISKFENPAVSGEMLYQLAYRTWRIFYAVDEERMLVTISGIRSGYTEEELNDIEDQYQDKPLHKNFRKRFS